MTRTEWLTLPEPAREAIRQASARQSLEGFGEGAHLHAEWERAMEVWAARDAYRVQNVALGYVGMVLVGMVLAFVALLTR